MNIYTDIIPKRPLTEKQLRSGKIYYRSKFQPKYISEDIMAAIVGLFDHNVKAKRKLGLKRRDLHNKLRDIKQEYTDRILYTMYGEIIDFSVLKEGEAKRVLSDMFAKKLDDCGFEMLWLKLDDYIYDNGKVNFDFLVSLSSLELGLLSTEYNERGDNKMAAIVDNILSKKVILPTPSTTPPSHPECSSLGSGENE